MFSHADAPPIFGGFRAPQLQLGACPKFFPLRSFCSENFLNLSKKGDPVGRACFLRGVHLPDDATMLGQPAASRPAAFGALSTNLAGAGAAGGKKKQSFADAAEGLREALLDARMNERVRDGFQKPSEILGFLEALVSVVAQGDDPRQGEPQVDDNWERLYSALAPSAGPGLIDRLFDCLDSLAPCQNCPCSVRRELPVDEVHVGFADRRHTLCVDGLSCYALRGGSSERVDVRVALAEAIQRQVQILNIITGINRVAWRLAAWKEAGGTSPEIPHWHRQLGLLPRVVHRFLKASCNESGAGHLLARLYQMSLCTAGSGDAIDENDYLVLCLRAKLLTAVKITLLSPWDHMFEERCAQTPALLPSHVASLLTLRILRIEHCIRAAASERAPQDCPAMAALALLGEEKVPHEADIAPRLAVLLEASWAGSKAFGQPAVAMLVGHGLDAVHPKPSKLNPEP